MTKAELYSIVERIRSSLDIKNNSYPIDAFNLCSNIKRIKIQRVMFNTKELRGMLCVAKNQTENHVILINGRKSWVEQNYHSAHEFMHIFSDTTVPGSILTCYDTVRPNQDDYTEWFANEGAAELLVPYRIFVPIFCSLYYDYLYYADKWYLNYKNENVKQVLAKSFGVSEVVITHRINNLAYEINQYMNGILLPNIDILSRSKQDSYGISVPDFNSILSLEECKRYIDISFNGMLSANY